jgi:hypothetical protein
MEQDFRKILVPILSFFGNYNKRSVAQQADRLKLLAACL